MSAPRFALDWQPRATPLAPAAVAGVGNIARALVRYVLTSSDTDLQLLNGVTAAEVVVLLGRSEILPWVDGVCYLGRDGRAPKLLLPTQREPTLPVDLVERALLQRSPVPPPLAILDRNNLAISVSHARALSRRTLEKWLGSRT